MKVELDKTLQKDLEENSLKPRHHIGRNTLTAPTIPRHILSAILKITGDFPIKAIVEEGEKLSRYIQSRHLPAEDKKVKERKKEIEQDIDNFPEKYKLHKKLKGDPESEEYRKREKEIKSQIVQRIVRQRVYSWQAINYDEYKSLAYVFGRSAQEYSVILKIFSEIQKRDPKFQPRSYFDFGSGVGSGCWAAAELWKNQIYEYYLVDASKFMNDLLDLILRGGDVNKDLCMRNVNQRQFLPAKAVRRV